MRLLFDLLVREMFEFGVIQSDPNFANYRYQPDSGKLVLLDFGAARSVNSAAAKAYHKLIIAALNCDRENVLKESLAAGFVSASAIERHGPRIDAMIEILLGELNRPGDFDFGDRRFVKALGEQGFEIADDKTAWHIPPTELLFIQRKISGMALLATRLQAKVDIRSLVNNIPV